MKKLKIVVTIFAMLFSVNELQAQEANREFEFAESIYQKSGINGYLNFYSSQLDNSFGNVLLRLEEHERDLMQNCFNKSLLYDEIKSLYINYMSKSQKFSNDDRLLKELSNPIFQKIEKQRFKTLNADEEKVKQYISELELSDEQVLLRISLLEDIIDKNYSTEFLIDGALNITRVIVLTVNMTRPKSDRTPMADIKKRNDSERETMISLSKRMMVMQFLYVYRDINIDDLKQYHNFISSEIGSQYSSIVYKGFVESFANAIDNFQYHLSQLNI